MSHNVAPGLGVATLERIIPVAQQCRADEVVVTVTTLERHSDGFVINVRADWFGPGGAFPRLVWKVDDGRGTTYTRANCGGGGGRGGDYPTEHHEHSWRLHCLFAPAIAPDADTLTLELAAFGLREPILEDGSNERFKGWKKVRDLNDLGSITVDLRR